MSLKHSLLALLVRSPKTGYDLSKNFEKSTGFFWQATHQQIYKELHEIEKQGWIRYREVVQESRPDKKIYAITLDGKNELKKWMSEESIEKPGKDSFLIKLFVGDLVAPHILLKELLRQRKVHQDRLIQFKEIETQYFAHLETQPHHRRFQYLTLKRGILYEKLWLDWSNDVEELLTAPEESNWMEPNHKYQSQRLQSHSKSKRKKGLRV